MIVLDTSIPFTAVDPRLFVCWWYWHSFRLSVACVATQQVFSVDVEPVTSGDVTEGIGEATTVDVGSRCLLS